MPVDPEKLAKAVEAARATWVKFGEQLDVVEALLNETPTDGQLARKLYTYFIAKWERRHKGQTFIPVAGKDIGQLTRLVKATAGDADDLKARVDRYFASTDPFYADRRHPLALFISNVNKLGGPVKDETFLAPAPLACHHTPQCRSEQEHTQRMVRETRR